MAAARTWTDFEVASLLDAMAAVWFAERGDAGCLAALPYARALALAEARFVVHAHCAEHVRGPWRRAIKTEIRAVRRAVSRRKAVA